MTEAKRVGRELLRGKPSAWAYREAAVRWLQTLGISCWTRRRALVEIDRLAREIHRAQRELDDRRRWDLREYGYSRGRRS